MLLAGVSALGMGSSEAQSELDEREQVQAEQAAAAADLEPATAQDAELETALAALSDQVRTQEALVDRAEQARILSDLGFGVEDPTIAMIASASMAPAAAPSAGNGKPLRRRCAA